VNENAPADRKTGAWARKIWLAYTLIALAGALALLAVYVNAYDDYDIGDRLRGLGRFTRKSMSLLTFPLGMPAGLLADGPLRAAFGCGDANEPCAIFVTWQVQFTALVAQIVFLRWLIARRFQSGA
jgi:hypothetical protein